MKTSVLQSVGIGTVAVNKPLGTKEVQIVITEWFAMHDGGLSINPTDVEYSSVESDGKSFSGKVTSDLTIVATWLPKGSNRLTAPDVRRGEVVEIFRVANADIYYWRPVGLNDNLRKLETIIFGISATQDESDTELNPENMYWFEISSHSKRLAFSSSKADGEPFLYEMFFDFAKGTFTLTDDIDNQIHLNSKERLIHVENADGAFLKLDKKDIKAYAPKNIQADAERDVNISAGNDITAAAANTLTIKGGGSYLKMNSSETTLKTPKFKGSR